MVIIAIAKRATEVGDILKSSPTVARVGNEVNGNRKWMAISNEETRLSIYGALAARKSAYYWTLGPDISVVDESVLTSDERKSI